MKMWTVRPDTLGFVLDRETCTPFVTRKTSDFTERVMCPVRLANVNRSDWASDMRKKGFANTIVNKILVNAQYGFITFERGGKLLMVKEADTNGPGDNEPR